MDFGICGGSWNQSHVHTKGQQSLNFSVPFGYWLNSEWLLNAPPLWDWVMWVSTSIRVTLENTLHYMSSFSSLPHDLLRVGNHILSPFRKEKGRYRQWEINHSRSQRSFSSQWFLIRMLEGLSGEIFQWSASPWGFCLRRQEQVGRFYKSSPSCLPMTTTLHGKRNVFCFACLCHF